MSSTKFNPTRALKVIPSNNCNVPSPNLLALGKPSEYDNPLILIDSTAKFILSAESEAPTGAKQFVVNVGDVVYCYDTQIAATIVEVIDAQTLLLNADVFGVLDDFEYYIYQEGPTTGQGNQGCLLYLAGSPNSLHITTIGGDEMNLIKTEIGLFEIQTKKVHLDGTTTAVGDIYAVW